MITIQFSKDEIKTLKDERYRHPHPRIQEKMEALYLKSMGVAHGEICRLCDISRPTLAKFLHSYQVGGIEGLRQWEYAGQASKLNKHSGSLEAHFRKHPPASSNQAVEEIEKLTGIRRSPTQVREYMRRIGMRCRKTGFVPKGVEDKQKQAEQEEFVKKNSNPNYRRPKQGRMWCFF